MPNLESIIITNCIGIAVVILTLVSSVETRRSKTPDTRLLTVMLLMIALSCFMEALSYIVDGKTWSSARALGMLSNTWLYLSNPTFAAIWCLYVDYRMYQSLNRLKRFRPLLMLTGFIWLTIIGNIFGGYLFIIDEQNFYHRLPLAYVYFAIPFLYVGISIADVYGYKRRHGGLSFFPIWVFVILFMIGCIIQASFYGISVAWCCLALAVAGVYMSLQNQLLYHDPLTGLYNRYCRYFEGKHSGQQHCHPLCRRRVYRPDAYRRSGKGGGSLPEHPEGRAGVQRSEQARLSALPFHGACILSGWGDVPGPFP